MLFRIPLLAGAFLVLAMMDLSEARTVARPGSPLPTPPAWSRLKAAYDYHPSKVSANVKPQSDSQAHIEHIAFISQEGERVPGLFVRPITEGRYPCVLLLHGLGSDKETMVEYFGKPLAEHGIASLALDANLHGERKDPSLPADQLSRGLAFYGVVRGGVLEYRQALDYLVHRKDVDPKKVGLLGYSMGAIMGAILAAVEPRIDVAVLCVGGDPIRPYLLSAPEGFREEVETISPSNYVGHISPRPVYLVNGTHDEVIRKDSALLLQRSAKEPKTVVWADSGHILPVPAVEKAMRWLAEKIR